uniref:TonB-dependent receptor family protein n=1 Tax=Cellvibrio fontiphilus TaxID=1815559 RepID=UPI002B4BAB33|nr:TonB-dependent receptor [Cellvibrio fontiphilus]
MFIQVKSYLPFVTLSGLMALWPISHVQAQEMLETLIVSGDAPAPAMADRVMSNHIGDFHPGARLDSAELLQNLPGIQVDSRSNYAQDTRISLRGFGARSAFGVRGIDLQVDGIPMSTPDGQGQLGSVILDNIQRVEVLRGPIAGLYGNGAGGVIALQTAAPEISQLSLGVAAGDPGLQRQTLAGEWREGAAAARLQLANTQVDGERPHSYAERQQGIAQVYYRTAGDLDISLKHERNRDPLLQDPLSLRPEEWRNNPRQTNPIAEAFNTRKTVDYEQTSVSLRQSLGATRWQTSLWQGERAITQYLGFSGDAISGSGGLVDLARDFAGASATLSQGFELLTMPADLSLGLELAQMEDRRRGFVNNNGTAGDLRRNELGKVDSLDGFALLQLTPLSGLSLYSGARRGQMDVDVEDYFVVAGNPDDSGARDYRETAYAFGGNYQLDARWEIFASRGRGYETPTLTEMAYKRVGSGLNTTLEAALNYQTEWGIAYRQDDRLELVLTRFAIDSNNELLVDQSLGGRTSYRNAAATEREGSELFGRYAFGSNWRLLASAQFIDAIFADGALAGKQLPGVAAEQYQLGLQWLPFGSEALQLAAQLQQRSRVFTADDNAVAAPGYRTFDLSAQGEYPFSAVSLRWWLKLANLGDENYVGSVVVNQANGRAFEPALGRNVTAGINVQYAF